MSWYILKQYKYLLSLSELMHKNVTWIGKALREIRTRHLLINVTVRSTHALSTAFDPTHESI